MKRIGSLFALLVSTTIISGCGNKAVSDKVNSSPVQVENNSKGNKQGPQGFTVNKIEFSELKENELPGNMANAIKILKPNRGYIYEEVKDAYYIVIFSGKKPTGGYSIKVNSIEDVEGRTNIIVEENSPKPEEIVTQAITYPYTVVKASQITHNFTIKNTKGESFEELKKEWQEH